jgi:hypothetical protein
MKRLKAFTLADMMVSMIISSLVIAFAYTAYLVIVKNFYSFKASNQETEEVHTLYGLMKQDIATCLYMRKQDNNLVLQMPAGSGILYQIGDLYVLRKLKTRQDTFQVKVHNVNSFFKTIPVVNAGALIDEVQLDTELSGEKQSFTLTKRYGADIVMYKDSLDKINYIPWTE